MEGIEIKTNRAKPLPDSLIFSDMKHKYKVVRRSHVVLIVLDFSETAFSCARAQKLKGSGSGEGTIKESKYRSR